MKKITDDNYSSLGLNISKLAAATINHDLIGEEIYSLTDSPYSLLCIQANKSISEWFKDEFGDWGRYLTHSCDNTKYVTLYNAGRLIAMQSLGPDVAKEDTCEVAEQEKATDQLLVVERVNVERGDSINSTTNGDNARSSTNEENSISSTTPWPN